jgi:hypothetical protein
MTLYEGRTILTYVLKAACSEFLQTDVFRLSATLFTSFFSAVALLRSNSISSAFHRLGTYFVPITHINMDSVLDRMEWLI